jgi:hypothetical protein
MDFSITVGLIPRSLLRKEQSPRFLSIYHSRTFLSEIQARPELAPRLKHSGVTPLG